MQVGVGLGPKMAVRPDAADGTIVRRSSRELAVHVVVEKALK